jgi:outer membrane lipoprotein-sorting protein
MKRLSLLVLLIILTTGQLIMAQSNKAITYLDKMQKKYQNLPGFVANFSLDLGDGSPMVGEISVMGNWYKLKMGGQEIYNNGDIVSTYFKELNEVTITDYDPEEDELSPAKIYHLDKSKFTISLVKEDANTVQVLLVPKTAGAMAKLVLTIDKASSTLKSWVMTEKTGGKQTFKVTKMNTQVKLTKNVFEFNNKAHPGVDINDLR